MIVKVGLVNKITNMIDEEKNEDNDVRNNADADSQFMIIYLTLTFNIGLYYLICKTADLNRHFRYCSKCDMDWRSLWTRQFTSLSSALQLDITAKYLRSFAKFTYLGLSLNSIRL